MRLILEESNSQDSHHLIIGYLNFPEINWENWSSTKNEHHVSCKLVDCITDCYHFQHITYLSQIRKGQNSNTPDLVLPNMEHMIQNLQIEPQI